MKQLTFGASISLVLACSSNDSSDESGTGGSNGAGGAGIQVPGHGIAVRSASPPCLSFQSSTDAEGRIVPACSLVEASVGELSCDGLGRRELDEDRMSEVREELEQMGSCGSAGSPCSEVRACEIVQLAGSERDACLQNTQPLAGTGYCYIDGLTGGASVSTCDAPARSELRFAEEGAPTPRIGTDLFLVCKLAEL